MTKKFVPFYRKKFMKGSIRPIKTMHRDLLMKIIANSKDTSVSKIQDCQISPVQHFFSDFSLDQQLLANIKSKGYIHPTQVQDHVIPSVLNNRDVIATANTGTGKTAAFLIPLIQKTIKDKTQRVLIIAPTRELAFQINSELYELSRGLHIRSALIIGGAGMWKQIQDIKQNPQYVIATPGRLKDFIQTHQIHLSSFQNVVLDEADRMVDVGFINEIKYFVSLLAKSRQSLFFSATISGKVTEILADFVINPVKVSVKTQDSAVNIIQNVIKVTNNMSKEDMLHEMLQKKEFEKVLIFGRTKHGVQRLSDKFSKRGIRSGAIHGNKRQNQRQNILNQFKRNEIQILFATDVASRGLDIPNVSHVINYDLPETMEDYIHRIGRTGRVNKTGIALTFIDG